MYTRNQLIVAGLLIAGASALVTYMYIQGKETTSGFFGKPPRKIISTTSGEPISYATGTKMGGIIRTKTKSGENLKWVVNDHNPNDPDAMCSGFWVSQYGSDHWQCIPKTTEVIA